MRPLLTSRRYVLIQEMKFYIFGLRKKVSRPTEIVVGIFFMVSSFFIGQKILGAGNTEEIVAITSIFLPLFILGIVILCPRKIARDMLIYFFIFFMTGIACFLVGFMSFRNSILYLTLFVVIGISCILLSYKYFQKISF